ncbi:MAG: hypothetical protein R6U93_04645 [Dehalococcoidia bacterium]
MAIEDRDYLRGSHPPNCSCVDCTNRRLRSLRKETNTSFKSNRPRSDKNPGAKGESGNAGWKASNTSPSFPDWLKALLLVFAASIVGLTISTFAESYLPFWPVFGFSIFYSIEKWFYYLTKRYKGLGKLYRLVLNLSILSLPVLLIWLAVKLFSHQLAQHPLVGSLMLVAGFVLFVWLCKVAAKNSWRWPSMKLTVFSLICLFLIFSFAGVQPLSDYKDGLFNSISNYFRNPNQPDTTPSASDTIPSPSDTTPSPSDTTPPRSDEINSHTGAYEDYYLGLVHTSGGYLSGNGCYDNTGDFIVLINNENARDPSYFQLVSFLRHDNTDQFPYIYTMSVPGVYYGSAESHVDLEHIQNIIDGAAQPGNPHVCADFAERLHNNAELAGIRCAYVSITLAGNTGHACNAFQTTDRGLVYVDVTGWPPGQPHPDRAVSTVSIVVGRSYTPVSLFHEAGWQDSYVSMGIVTDFQVVWDGSWND